MTNYEVKIRVLTPHNLDMAGNEQIVQYSSREISEDAFTPSFKPGMSATVDVETQTVRNVVSVPIQAVTVRDFAENTANFLTDSVSADTGNVASDMIIPEEDLRKVVFVVEDGKAYRKEVETGISDNTHIQILSGIEAGEQVVIGSYRTLSRNLSDGDRVTINNQMFNRMASN